MKVLSYIAVLACAAGIMFVFFWLFKKPGNICPDCDGKGHWYSLRHREKCKTCNGTGKLK